MSVQIQDILTANLVLLDLPLLTEQSERNAFADAVISEITTERVVPGPTPPPMPEIPPNLPEQGLVLNLNKDRIAILTSSNRTAIERQYPQYTDLDRLAEVAGHAFRFTNLGERVPSSFGYNIDLVYAHSSSLPSRSYLAERLYAGKIFGSEGWNLVGGTGRLFFEEAGAQWVATIEPRANDTTGKRVFLSLNLHRSDRRLPSQPEILYSLQHVWGHALAFVDRLDESV